MITAKVVTTDKDKGFRDLMKRMTQPASEVKIGIQADEEQTLLIIAAANEYGATINHPGGTSFGFKTETDAKKGKVRFLKKGKGFMELGKTQAHTIKIPARSYIRSTVDKNGEAYDKLINKLTGRIIDGNLEPFDALQLLGMRVEADIKRTMTTLKTPPNKPSTVRRKKSNNPLIDTGHLRESIRYVIE